LFGIRLGKTITGFKLMHSFSSMSRSLLMWVVRSRSRPPMAARSGSHDRQAVVQRLNVVGGIDAHWQTGVGEDVERESFGIVSHWQSGKRIA
jgi:hypothetical protein